MSKSTPIEPETALNALGGVLTIAATPVLPPVVKPLAPPPTALHAHDETTPLTTTNPLFPVTKQLSADQERDLVEIPEKFHARIVEILTSAIPIPVRRAPERSIDTVAEAMVEVSNEVFIVEEANRVVEVKRGPGRPRDPFKIARVKAKSGAYEAYINACRVRKDRIAELKELIRQGGINVEFAKWAAEQRAACLAYIEAHRPVADEETCDRLKAELGELLSNVPKYTPE